MASQVTTIASSAETTIVTAGTAGVNNALTGLIISTSGTMVAGTVTIKDSTGGTTRILFDYPVFSTAAGLVIPFSFFFPKDQPLFQAAPATNWTATCSAGSGTLSYHITAFYIEI
jgi:hypothetical protein